MTITTLILLLATGIVAVTAECQKDNAPMKLAVVLASTLLPSTRGNQEYIP